MEIETDTGLTGRVEKRGRWSLPWLVERASLFFSFFLLHRRTPRSKLYDSFCLHCPFSIGVSGQSERPSINFPHITIMQHTYIAHTRSFCSPSHVGCLLHPTRASSPLRDLSFLFATAAHLRHYTLTTNPYSCGSFPLAGRSQILPIDLSRLLGRMGSVPRIS